jgi:hypothetical protein
MPDWLDALGRGAATVGRFGANTLAIAGGAPLPFPMGGRGGWQHPERQKLALQYIPETLPPEEQEQRLETFRQVPLNNWPELIGQFQKQDEHRAAVMQTPEYQNIYRQYGPAGLQAFGMPLPPQVLAAQDAPLSAESQAQGLTAPSLPQRTRQDLLPPLPLPELAKQDAARNALLYSAEPGPHGELARRRLSGVGLTPEQEGETAFATALGTRQAQRPFDIEAEERASTIRMREKAQSTRIEEARAGREALLPTPAARTQAQVVLTEATGLTQIAETFLENLKPENVGAVAAFRRSTYGAASQSGALGDLLTKNRDAVLNDLAENNTRPGEKAGVDPTKYFDPSLSTIDMLGNVLAYRTARTLDPTGKLSDADIANAKRSLGLDAWFASDQDIRKRVGLLKEFAGKQVTAAQKVLSATPAGTPAPSGPLDLGDGFSLRFK